MRFPGEEKETGTEKVFEEAWSIGVTNQTTAYSRPSVLQRGDIKTIWEALLT